MTPLSTLTNRVFLASALLAVLSTGMAVYVVDVRVAEEAERQLQRGLEEADRLVAEHRATLLDSFLRTARLIADLPRLKAAVDLGDPPTVQPLAEEYRTQAGSALLVITDRAGRVVAHAGSAQPPGSIAAEPAVREARAGREATGFWPASGGLLQVVTVPIAIGVDTPEILGTLSVGFSLDDQLAQRFKALTDSEIAFAVDGRVQASTLPRSYADALAALVGAEGTSRLTLGGDEYVALSRRLPGATDAGGGVRDPTALILRSRSERLRFLGPLHRTLGATVLLAIALATLLSYAVARTVTGPLRALTATMSEIAATGDLGRARKLPDPGRWDDQDVRVLAGTFGSLTEALARFQREAGQRERLASLGRLSTVIAHEIRNPLMIIKVAVRALRPEAVSPEERRQGLQDIEGEVARLNHLVDDVLDFARPIRFELAPADLNDVCRAAATAATAGEPEGQLRLDLDPALPPAVTDASRLHGALVNVLTNARHAVKAKAEAGGGAGAPVELSTRPAGEGRFAIVVRDCGVGIPPEDLPRVSEPYFTTRRGGTGLGLAIARNIVEGLGGALSVESRAGEGTEVRLELPFTPPEAAVKRA